MFIKLETTTNEFICIRKDAIIAVKPQYANRSEITLITGDKYVVYHKMNDILSKLSPQHHGDNPIKFGDYMNPFDPDKRL